MIAHFAHKPPKNCDWAKGETLAHLEAKTLMRDSLTNRGLRAEVEIVVPALTGHRRADIMVWSPSGIQSAIELQHTAIGVDEIERRSFSYARAGIAQMWIPFLRPLVWADGEPIRDARAGDWFVEQFPAKPYERWVHGLNRRGIWFYDPGEKVLWRGRFAGHQLWVEETSWYSEDGDPMGAGGFHRWSKRWRELTLWGPYELDRVMIRVQQRRAWRTNRYNWPASRLGEFVVDKCGA